MAVDTEASGSAGTTLGYKIGAATVFTLLSQVIDLDLSGITVAPIPTTKLASTVKTYIPSIPDPGEVTFSVYDVAGDATVAQLRTLIGTPAVVSWQVMAPDGTSSTTGSTIVFSGFLTNYAPGGYAIDGTPIANVTIQITGAVTFTAGT